MDLMSGKVSVFHLTAQASINIYVFAHIFSSNNNSYLFNYKVLQIGNIMTALLFEQLENTGLLRGSEPCITKLEKMSKKELLDLLAQSVELTYPQEQSPVVSIFSQSASLSLSGDRTPCHYIGCRLNRIRNLAQYAVLYADKIYAYNILSYHLARHDIPSEEELKADVFDDLIILGYLRPLIEAKKIVLITPPQEFCPRCFGYHFAEKSFRKKADALYEWLRQKFLSETQVELEKLGPDYGYLISGPDSLVGHGKNVRVVTELPETLNKKSRIMAKVNQGEVIKLSRTVLERSVKLHNEYAAEVLQNVFFELACAQCFNTGFLTERALHVEALNYLSMDSDLIERNRIIQKYLTLLVPFIQSARMEDLIKLREKEPESFIIFRESFTKALSEYRSGITRPFGPEDARQLYGDIIEPSLSKLDQTLKSSTKKLLKGTAAKVIAWGGAISFGFYAGFVPENLVEAATALGLTHVLAELGSNLLGSRIKKEELSNNDMYFLWRVRELSS